MKNHRHRQTKEELTLTEQLLLNSLEVTAVCPKCGRAVLITPKDMYWTFGMTLVHEDGTKEVTEAGWRCECKCHYPIPVDVIMRVRK